MRLDDLNDLTPDAAAGALLRCCGSTRWAQAMAAARPFASLSAMQATADAIWASLAREDWLEAFGAHPRIGESATAAAPRWSAAEQSGVLTATPGVRERLAQANRDYDARFGHIFLVSASGKTAGEILEILERRLRDEPAEELRTAAEEQRKITRLRLAKLLES